MDNKIVGFIIMVLALAVLVGAALGWRFPMGSQSANQVSPSPSPSPSTSPTNNVPQPPSQQPFTVPGGAEESTPQPETSPIPALW